MFTREFPRATTSHSYTAVAGEVYSVKARSYKTVSGTKTRSGWTSSISVSIPSTVPAPTGFTAVLGSDKKSIDISWTAPAGVTGTELNISLYSSTTQVLTKEIAGSGAKTHTFQANPSEAYAITVHSYKTASGNTKTYSNRSAPINLGIPPEMDTCFVVPGRNGAADELRCFWANNPRVSEYQLEVSSRPASSGSTSSSGRSMATLDLLPVPQTLTTRLSSSIYKDIPIDKTRSYDIRIRAKFADPGNSDSYIWGAFTFPIPHHLEKLIDINPRCVQVSAETTASGKYPIRCYLPYFNRSVLNVYHTINGQDRVIETKTVNGGIVDSILLLPGTYTARWRFFGETDLSPKSTSFTITSFDFTECPTSIPLQSPIASPHDSIYSSYMYRFHPIHLNMAFHSGSDMGGPYGFIVKAAHSGYLVKVRYSIPTDDGEGEGGYGNYIALQYHEDRTSDGTCWHTFYAHLLDPDNSKCRIDNLPEGGDYVNAGDTIACVGATGTGTDPHLHFEIRHGDSAEYAHGNYISPDYFQRLGPLTHMFPSLEARGRGNLVQKSVKMGCPSIEANSRRCEESTQSAAAPPIVWCTSDGSSVTWKWSHPEGVTEFRRSSSAATILSGWTALPTTTDFTDATYRTYSQTGNPGQRLTFYLQAKRNSEAYWSWSGAASCVVKPRSVSITCPTIANTSITWSWTKPSTATTHEISFDESTWTAQGTGTKVVANLSAGDERTLYVRAKESGVDYWSWTGSMWCGTPLAAPRVSCFSTDSTITFRWNAPKGVDKYRVAVFANPFAPWTWEEYGSRQYRVSGLGRGEARAALVHAGREGARLNVASDWSAQGNAVCVTTPGSPVVSCTADSASIEWEWPRVTGATQYRWRREGGTTWTRDTDRSVTIDSLSSGTTITVEVQAGHKDAVVADVLYNYGWSSSHSAGCTTTSSTGK